MFARTVYAFNWYNIGAVLPLVGASLSATTPELGLVLGSFLAGAGVFQVPAGLAAIKWGSRRVSIASLWVMSAFCIASAFSPNWLLLAGLRFGAGAGAAFFFAPALGLMASYYPAGSRGPMVGLFNSGFSVGSGVGLFAGAFVGAAFGWGGALVVGGVALLASAVLAPFLLHPADTPRGVVDRAALVRESGPVLRSRAVWALGLASVGLWSAFYVAAQYFVQYSHAVHPGWSLALAAGLPALMIACEIPSGPLGGWLAERGRDMRWILAVFGVLSGAAVVLLPFSSLAGLVALFALLGIFDGIIWAALYLIPTYLPEVRGEGVALGLALLNAINIFGGSGLVVAFAFVAALAGYPWAWALAGFAAIAPLPLLLLVRGDTRRAGASEPRTPDLLSG